MMANVHKVLKTLEAVASALVVVVGAAQSVVSIVDTVRKDSDAVRVPGAVSNSPIVIY